MGFDGNANINTLIEGTVAKPLLDGQIMLDGAEIAISDPRVVLSELNGPIVLDGQRAVFDGVRGLANGGALALDGTLEFEGMALSGGELNIQAQGVALELPKGMRSELDALVIFRPDPRNPSLTGDIRVVQSAYTETITIAALARQAALPVSGPSVQRPYLERLQLNLALTTTDDIIVDNNYGRLAAEVAVRLLRHRRATRPRGPYHAPRGRADLPRRPNLPDHARRYFLQRSTAHSSRVQHRGRGQHRRRHGNIKLTLTGTLERPTIDLTSETAR